MRNLLEETEEALEQIGATFGDVIFIGSSDGRYSCSVDEFKKLADIEYNARFGGQEIATDLVIELTNGRVMSRGEYDGSEWWDFTTPIPKLSETLPIITLKGNSSWSSLDELSKQDERQEQR
jgi:hypothetical protein